MLAAYVSDEALGLDIKVKEVHKCIQLPDQLLFDLGFSLLSHVQVKRHFGMMTGLVLGLPALPASSARCNEAAFLCL